MNDGVITLQLGTTCFCVASVGSMVDATLTGMKSIVFYLNSTMYILMGHWGQLLELPQLQTLLDVTAYY